MPNQENAIKMRYPSGFCSFLDDLKCWVYVIEVVELDGVSRFVRIHQEMAEIALFGNFTKKRHVTVL